MPSTRIKIIWLFLSLFLFLPVSSFGFSLSGNFRTYLQSRETASSAHLLPLYEYLDFNGNEIGMENISFHFGGWGKADLGDLSSENRLEGNIQYAYLSYKTKAGNAVFNLGRQFVMEGVAAEQMDGIYARTNFIGGFGFSAFGGIPAEIDGESRKNEYLFGGRINQGVPGIYVLGISYLQGKNLEETVRKEGGVDLWLRPWEKLQIQGKSAYSFEPEGWMEHAYSLVFTPVERLTLRAEGSWVDYETYFHSATLSVFKSPNINLEEKVLAFGGAVDLRIIGNFFISGDYKKYDYDLSGSANYYGGKLAYSNPAWGGAGIAAHRMDGKTDRLKYTEYRAYAYKKISRFDFTADFLFVDYDSAINGVTEAYSIVGAAGCNLTESIRIAADIEYSHNPDFDQDVRGFFKFLYRFGIPGKKEAK